MGVVYKGWANMFFRILYASFSSDAIDAWGAFIGGYPATLNILRSCAQQRSSNQLMEFFECFMSPFRELFPAYYQLEWERGTSIKPTMAFFATPIQTTYKIRPLSLSEASAWAISKTLSFNFVIASTKCLSEDTI